MLDRVREALFSTLGPGIEGALLLDLFAGSGSLGLEALSRGAAFARLVEAEPGVVKVLTANVEALELEREAQVVCADALDSRNWLPPPGQPERWPDLVLCDPPYPWLGDHRREPLLAQIRRLARDVLRPEGLLVLHTPKRGLSASDFDEAFDASRRTYGTSALWYLRAPAEEAPVRESTAQDP